jgi:hypothetical protein
MSRSGAAENGGLQSCRKGAMMLIGDLFAWDHNCRNYLISDHNFHPR